MKKLLVFLMAFLGISIFSLGDVSASNYSFYEGEYIDGIYLTKEKGGTRYYQKARFFRVSGTNDAAYCIEPFSMFNENGTYQRSLVASNLTSEQMMQIHNIINFGYRYGSHQDWKWYAITQYMVWQVADPTGNYYFTDGLDGNRIDIFQNEINEINSLIEEYYRLPSISDNTINIVEKEEITLIDTNNVLSKYKSDDENIIIDNNRLIIKDLVAGDYRIHLYRKEVNTAQIPFFYNSDISQNMATSGDLNQIDIYLNVNVSKTGIEITKVDSDTKTTIPSGDASLSGAKYELLNKDKNKIAELVIDEEMKAKVENVKYGTYYLREIEAGIGYQLDDNIYEIIVNKDNPIINLTLENKVIKKDIEIHKNYGDEKNFNDEVGISFDIIDSKDNLYDTITTDNNGIATTTLPFGKYLVKQKNSTYGYTTVDDFKISVEDLEKEIIELYDYKIKVPNTYVDNNITYSFILIILIGISYVKKMLFA